MTAIRFHPAFETDLEQAWLRITRAGSAVADGFIDAVERTVSQIARQPQIGWQRPWKHQALIGLRSWRVEGFPKYLVFYRIEHQAIAILAVLHGARLLERILKKR